MSRWCFLVFLLGLTACAHCNPPRKSRQALAANLPCTNPRGEAGLCIGIKQCQPLLQILRQKSNDPASLTFLRRSVCGRSASASDPLVCCPRASGDAQTRTVVEPDTHPKLLSPPNCGVSQVEAQTKIVGGQPAELGAWPWIAALGYRSSSRPGPLWLCGGALISDKYILTAAHCTKHPTLTLYLVRLGDLDLNRTDDGATPVDVQIERAIPHPQYNPSKYTDDVALLLLKETVKFSKFIQPICVPKLPTLRSNKFVKYSPFVAGWGSISFKGPSSTALMEVQIPIVDNVQCNNSYWTKGTQIVPRQLCAGRSGKDACQGDSGGPMMLPQGPAYYIIGVVSYGFRCAEAGFPGIYSRVTEYTDWIANTMT